MKDPRTPRLRVATGGSSFIEVRPMLSPERIQALCDSSRPKLDAMRAELRARGSALVAFSGGVDSTFVLKIAVEELGERALALTALSASVAPEEEREARELAAKLGA